MSGRTNGQGAAVAAPVARVQLGRTYVTRAAVEALAAAGVNAADLLARHERGDWGEVGAEDWAANDHDLAHGGRLLSAYTLPTGVRTWVITEWDRSATTVLLPEDY